MKFYIILALAILTCVVSNEELKCKPRPGCHFSGCDPTAGPSFIVLDRNEYPLTCQATDIRKEIAQNEQSLRYLMNITLGSFKQTSKLVYEIQHLKSKVSDLTKANNELTQDFSKFVAETKLRLEKVEKERNNFSKFVAETKSRLEKLEKEKNRPIPISLGIPQVPQSSPTVPILTATRNDGYPRSFHCDFQKPGDTCGLVNDEDKNDRDWIQYFGPLPAKFFSPKNPILNRNDGYMYVDAAPQDPTPAYAYLRTPRLASGNYCIQIRVFMTTDGVGALEVGVHEYKGAWSWTKFLKDIYAHSFVKKSWIVLRHEYTSQEGLDFIEIGFVGWRSSKESRFYPAIIIDDIRIVQERC